MDTYEGDTPAKLSGGGAESPDFRQELKALGSVLEALSPLPEDARKFVLRTASDRLGLSLASPASKENSLSVNASNSMPQSGGLEGTSPKEFLRVKKPSTEMQRMVCLAYYLTHARGKAHFKTQDLTGLNTEAAGGKFSNPSVTVRNATSQSGFFAPGTKGTKQITAHGEEYVESLPDQEAAKTVVLSRKPKAKRRVAKNAS